MNFNLMSLNDFDVFKDDFDVFKDSFQKIRVIWILENYAISNDKDTELTSQ